jgi:hypothetical protein
MLEKKVVSDTGDPVVPGTGAIISSEPVNKPDTGPKSTLRGPDEVDPYYWSIEL